MHTQRSDNPGRSRTRLGTAVTATSLLLAVALLSGCGRHDDRIVTAAVPDRVEINHPIRLGEKSTRMLLPVLPNASGLTVEQREVVKGFAYGWRPRSGGGFSIVIPKGSGNGLAAEAVAADIVTSLGEIGVPQSMMAAYDYRPPAGDTDAAIILVRTELGAIAPVCGDYSENMIDNPENRHYRDFGCSTQANIAAMVANPADLLGPRAIAPADPISRSNAIERYRTAN